MTEIGRGQRATAEGYIPSGSSFSDRTLVSHETTCLLDAADRDAHVSITICFADWEPVGPCRVTVSARRVPAVDDSPSGTLEWRIAITATTLTAPPWSSSPRRLS